jgi:hypothetical protein
MKKCMYYYAVFVLKHFFRFKSFTLWQSNWKMHNTQKMF